MDGLDCNEMLYSEMCADNSTFRFDSEFFNKEIFGIERKIKLLPHFYLKLKEVVSGPFGSSLKSEAYLSSGDIPFVRIENIKGGFDINMDNIIYISQNDNDRIKNSQLKINDIILSKVGNSIGFFARVDETIGTCNISENNIGIKLSDYSDIEKHYILSYLNSLYAQKLVLRRTSGNAQPKLNVDDLCCIPIPKFSNEFYKKISSCILKSKILILNSKQLYSDAEKIIVDTIGGNEFNTYCDTVTIKTLKNSFGVSGRLDAEYYRPKYDMIFDKLNEFTTFQLGGKNGLVDIKKSIEPGSDYYQNEGIPFIRVSDINKFEISEPNIKLPQDIVENVESLYPQKDTILFSKDGSVGIAHKVQEDMKAITSSALLHLTIKNTDVILPDYLTLVLNSPIVQLQAERDTNGAIIQHWKPSDIEKVVIPILDMDVQKEIAKNMQESFKLRQESKRLLEYAVKAVEMAVESDENTANMWLEQKMEVF